jgi:hypothetical protein
MPELVVDFNDPESIADAIPQAETLIRQAEQQVAAAVEQADEARERASDAELDTALEGRAADTRTAQRQQRTISA